MIDNTNPNNYASKGVAGTGLGLGIAGTAPAEQQRPVRPFQ